LDEAYGIYFNDETFHFAVCACLARGLTDTTTRPSAMRVLSSFLEMTTWTPESDATGTARAIASSHYLALIRSRAVGQDELKDSLWLADRKSTRLNSSHVKISYAVFCLKKKIT